MKTLKKIDFWVQVISIFTFAVLSLLSQDVTFIVGYFFVGAWQLISMLVHQYKSWFTNRGSNRYYYHFITLAVVVSMCLAPVVPMVIFIFYIMIFAAPIMAVYYTSICFRELQVLEARAFIHLK